MGNSNRYNRDNSLTLSVTKEKITELGLRSSSANLLPSGTLLMTSRATVGEIKISTIPASTNQGFKNLIPNALVDKWYLFYQMLFHKESYKQLGNGSTFLEVSKSATESFEIYYAPLPEQRAIAEILSTVDEAIAQSESLVRKYQSIKQGLMSDLLTCGVDKNGELRNPEIYPNHFEMTDFGLFPRAWEITTLGKIISRSKGIMQTGPFGTQLHAYDYIEDGIPTMMPQNIDETGWINFEELPHLTQHKATELKRHALRINDLIFARRGELSKCAAIDDREEGWICGTDFMLVRVPSSVMIGKWFAHYYRNDICQRQVLAQAVGSTMKGINTPLLSSLIIALPSSEEQERIVGIIDAQEKIIREEETYHNKLLSLKHGLMQDLLSGQVRVKK